jgi:molecular chaperone DnaK (HSP70)
MPYPVGIDLGTTNSVVSVYRRGIPEPLTIDGRPTLPSVVSLRSDGTWLLGYPAKSRAYVEPDATIVSSKRHIAEPGFQYSLPGMVVTPEDVAVLLLKGLKQAASEALGENVSEAVITVPAYFNEAQKEATRRAGEAAGLRVIRLLPEPTAAAIAYGADKGKDQTLLVYDLGGGTFDVSILKVEGNEFRVLAVGGDGYLGGDDFDAKIIDWILGKVGLDLATLAPRQAQAARQKLRQAAEAAKIELADGPTTNILISDVGGRQIDLDLDLATYERLVEPLVKRTLDVTRQTLRDAGLTVDDIDRVLLVGGSTKNRIVRAQVTLAIREPYIADQVDMVVSHGAALVAASISLPDQTPRIGFSDLTAHSLGTDYKKEEQILFDAIIPRQTAYPCKRGRIYWTGRPFQERVNSGVFRGEATLAEDNLLLGELCMRVTRPMEDQVPIGVIFELDRDGVVLFTSIEFPNDERFAEVFHHYQMHDEMPVAQVETLLKSGWGYSESIRVKT